MAQEKLTKRVVEGIVPRPKGDVVLWDEVLPGFGVRVKPSGVRSYIIQYRNANGRSKRGTIGRHGKITLDQARKQARQIFADVGKGGDPVTEKATARQAPTVDDLLDRFLSDHVSPKRRERTYREYARLIDRNIRPKLGKLKVRGVCRNDVDRLHQSLKATPYQANRVLAVLSKAFTLAETWSMRADHTNPCRAIERFKEPKRQRILTDEEMRNLGRVLEQARQEQWFHQRHVIDAIYLLALTYRRLSDILTLTWDNVHIDDPDHLYIYLPQTKTVEQEHIISRQAAAFLRNMPRYDRCKWAFPRNNLLEHLTDNDIEKAWRNKIRKAASLEATDKAKAARLHDLRHTGGTHGGQTGANAYLLRELLGHATAAMTDRYVGREISPLQQLVNEVGSRSWNNLTGGKSATAIPLRKAEK